MKKILVLFICLALPLSALAQNNKTEKSPSVVLKDLKGKNVRLEDFKGKVILLNFWATWCPPCRAEIPELIKWQTEYQSRGLQIIGITYPPTNAAKVRSFARRNKINYPILFGWKKTKALFDSGETMPFSVVIDKDGNIKERIEGVIFDDEFDEKIKPLLKIDSEKKDTESGLAVGFKTYLED
ncbi:MAG TPA: TlpA disulfide reductase family protein [Pyrinomonadaceae bacterium]|jgi:thiol-disulfide isomerase/thioredoxin